MESVDWLINNSRRYPLLTPSQEINLGRQIKEWQELKDKPNKTALEKKVCHQGYKAYQRFFQSNIRLVVKCAGWYNRSSGSLTYDDLVGEGMLGLHHAINKFEPSKGYKFSTYAVWWIRQAISRAIDTKASMIYLSGSAQQLARRAYRYICDEEARTGKRPSLDAVAQHFNTPVQNLRLYLAHAQTLVSLDAPSKTDGTNPSNLIDLIEDPSSTLKIRDITGVEKILPRLLRGLGKIERDIILRRYFLDDRDTYDVIAKDHGVSRERIRQVHDRAIRQMRSKLTAYGYAPAVAPTPQCA